MDCFDPPLFTHTLIQELPLHRSGTSGVSSTCAVKGGSGDSDGAQSGDSSSQPAAGAGTRRGHKPADSVESLEDLRRSGQLSEMHRCACALCSVRWCMNQRTHGSQRQRTLASRGLVAWLRSYVARV